MFAYRIWIVAVALAGCLSSSGVAQERIIPWDVAWELIGNVVDQYVHHLQENGPMLAPDEGVENFYERSVWRATQVFKNVENDYGEKVLVAQNSAFGKAEKAGEGLRALLSQEEDLFRDSENNRQLTQLIREGCSDTQIGETFADLFRRGVCQ